MGSLRDNHNEGTVGSFLQEVIKPDSTLSIVSAYFTIYAYQQLKNKLDKIERLQFLFGEPTFLKSIDPSKVNKREFKIEDDQLVIPAESRMTQKSVARECADWIREKVEIRSMVKPNFLHGKMYHIQNPNGVKEAIMGSSNFTVNGLGLGGSRNIELNMVIQDRRDLDDLEQWFKSLWNDQTGLVEDVKEQVLKDLAQFYIENEPEFIYYKTLYHIFEQYLADQDRGGLLDAQSGFFESEIWSTLYEFQQDGVKGAINKMLKHNGCIIADSVGLGKTYEALAVIKYFELLNKDVLVLCPKKLVNNWTIYQARQNSLLNPFKRDRFNYSVMYHTDLGREVGRSDANGIDLEHLNWGAYGLVVIDESHNFRGNPVEREKKDGSTKMNRAMWLLEKIIKSGAKTRVLLLSATPVNNNLRDLRNQLLLITEGRKDALLDSAKIHDIENTLKNAQNQFTRWADRKLNPERNVKQLLERLDSSFFKLLDELTIARSRKHVTKFYDTRAIGKFSERLKPKSVYAQIDTRDKFFTYDKLNERILKYKLSVFNPSAYIKPGFEAKYEKAGSQLIFGFTQRRREHFLIGMMKVNYLKRLESSVESFEISLQRTIDKINDLQEKIRLFQKKNSQSLVTDLSEFQPGDDEMEEGNEENEEWQVGKKLKFDLADLDLKEWLKDLEDDKDALEKIRKAADDVTPERDAKLKMLKELILEKREKQINPGNTKVIIFTAFADTAAYLYSCLKPWARESLGVHIGLVAGSFTETTLGKNEYSNILTNFAPFAKGRAQMPSMKRDEEIDILIGTDCISEGQNLQDCDTIINYDIHWNPVRIIQRFGRIDRLGSRNEKIKLINFWPTEDLDNYINLKERVESRMALVDVTATGEDNVLNAEQLEDLIEDDLKFRNQQLKRLQNEVLDLEEMNESITLTDFTLDDFRVELSNYLETNREKLKDAPLGLYAVVPAPDGAYGQLLERQNLSDGEKRVIQPGVVFCLRQKGDTEGNEQVNPLQPYFLIYIYSNGQVRFNYTNAKQILEAYRLMCQGRTEPYSELCDLFNAETAHGEHMGDYSKILNAAVQEIIRVHRKRASVRLTTDRSAVLIPKKKQASDADSFELITWLVIK